MTLRGMLGGLVLAVSAGCASSATGVEADRLEGRWEWRSASGGIAGRTITPASEGYSMELRFDGDRVQLLRNGALRTTASYRLRIGREGGSFPDHDVAVFTPALFGWEEMAIQIDEAGQLILSDGCCDGFTYAFARVGSVP
jgi:hypothetical protein